VLERVARSWARPAVELLALAAVIGWLKHDTLKDPWVWDSLGGIAMPTFDALDHDFRVFHPEGLNFGHPPLFHLGLAVVFRLFGTSLLVAHLVGLTCVVATLAFTTAIARQAFGPRASLAAAVLTLSHTLFFSQAGVVNDAQPLAALSMGVLWAFLRRKPLAFTALSCALVLTKETGALVVASLAAFTMLAAAAARRRPAGTEWGFIVGSLVAGAVLVGWFAAQRQALGVGPRTELFGAVPPALWLQTLWRHLVTDGTPAATNRFNGVLVGLALAALWRARGVARLVAGLGLGLFAAHVALFTVTVDMPRYHAPAVPFLALAASAWWSGGVSRAQWLAEVAVLGLWVGASTAGLHTARVVPGYLEESTLDYRDSMHAHREAAAWLEAHLSGEPVRTTWPMTMELTEPRLGYVTQPLEVVPSKGEAPGLYLLSSQVTELSFAQLPAPHQVLFTADVGGRRAVVVRAGATTEADARRRLVDAVVRGLLGRSSTSADRDHLLAANSPQALVRQVLTSEEHRLRRPVPVGEQAAQLYRGVLRRTPDAVGLAATIDAIERGRLEERLLDMLISEEFERAQTTDP
jgi:hypothetical protein